MTTGDLKNNLRKLQNELKAVHYTLDVDFESLGNGKTADYLPIYHYIFMEYSRPLSAKIAEMDVEMFGKTDLRFIESVYRFLRELFAYKPPVTKQQFFAPGFGERKVIMCTQILQLMRVKHQSLVGSTKSSSSKTRHIQSTKILPHNSPTAAHGQSATTTEHPITATVFPRVVNETRLGLVQDVSLASALTASSHLQTADCTVLPTDSSHLQATNRNVNSEALPTATVTNERRQIADDVIKIQLMEAFSKINGTVEQISSRLEQLDRRLVKVESMRQRLSRFDDLERRIDVVEQTVDTHKSSCESSQQQNIYNVDLVSCQLNNLVARMTLVENKLIMLQTSTEPMIAASANGHSTLRSCSTANIQSMIAAVGQDINCQSESVVQLVTDGSECTETEHRVTEGDDIYSGTVSSRGASISEHNSTSIRSEQLNRIEDMLRGTEEMLNINSSKSQQDGVTEDKNAPACLT